MKIGREYHWSEGAINWLALGLIVGAIGAAILYEMNFGWWSK